MSDSENLVAAKSFIAAALIALKSGSIVAMRWRVWKAQACLEEITKGQKVPRIRWTTTQKKRQPHATKASRGLNDRE